MLKINPSGLAKERMRRVLTTSELSRLSSLSPLTVRRVEQGFPARPETIRSIIAAMDLTIEDGLKKGIITTD